MKRHLFVIVLVLAMLTMFTGTVLAAPMASGSVTLLSVVFVRGKGPVFTFEVSGDYTKSDLKGALHVVNGADYDLYCVQVDSHTVTCTAPKKAGGHDVTLSWGGHVFSAHTPSEPSPRYCYSIWDWWDFTNYEWTDFGPTCQNTPAQMGDLITYTVPDPNGSYESWVIFYDVDVSGECTPAVPYDGPAYYYPVCPPVP